MHIGIYLYIHQRRVFYIFNFRMFEPKEEGTTESDEEKKEEERKEGGEPKKRFKAPHRKFVFNKEIR